MTRTIELVCTLSCTPDQAWHHVQTTRLLHHIAAPLIRFVPLKGSQFPAKWSDGEYRARIFLLGFIPLGWQAIVISKPEAKGEIRYLRDNGFSPLIRRWDHRIEVGPADGDQTRYVDRVEIDAGILTPLVAVFAKVFFSHRQSRWVKLAASDFADFR